MWTPVVFQPIADLPAQFAVTQPNFNAYALGWDITDYRGTKVVMHTGAVFGFLSAVVMIPDRQVGFTLLINSEDGWIIRGLIDELLDHYLGAPPAGWPEKYAAFAAARTAAAVRSLAATPAAATTAGPSLPLPRYAGAYVDPWYGRVTVGTAPGGLTIDFTSTPRMRGRLEHFQYDSFVTHFDDPAIEPAYVTFAIDEAGRVAHVTLKPVSPLADFSYDYQDLQLTPAKVP